MSSIRLNKFIAQATGMSRRAADRMIEDGRVQMGPDKLRVTTGRAVDTTNPHEIVWLDDKQIALPAEHTTIMLNKPPHYVVSRDGQGSATVYDLLPKELYALKPVGRLDKDSSGLLILTDDGELAQRLTHPRFQKVKQYEIRLDTALQPLHRQMISDHGLMLQDGLSKLQLERVREGNDFGWRVTMTEGRNRQIRRTFESLGYRVVTLHRITFGPYLLGNLASGAYTAIETP